MKQEYSEHKILKIRKEHKGEFQFLIEEIYWQSFIVKKDEYYLSESRLEIHFIKELCSWMDVYNPVPWSIKWERSCSKEDNKVIYGHFGKLKVDEKYRRIGLGGYLLDSLTQWAQENFNDSIVTINIKIEENMNSPEIVRKHLYGKRNIYNGVKISEVQTLFQESEDFKVINAADYLLELFKENRELKNNLADSFSTNQYLRQLLSRKEYRNILPIVVSLALGWFLRGMFG